MIQAEERHPMKHVKPLSSSTEKSLTVGACTQTAVLCQRYSDKGQFHLQQSDWRGDGFSVPRVW